MWAQFMTYQAPAVQNLMSAYMEHSKTMLEQMQQQFQAQSQNFLASFQFPGFGTPPQSGTNGAKTEQNAQPETPNKEPGH